jgi:hypothetical protein
MEVYLPKALCFAIFTSPPRGKIVFMTTHDETPGFLSHYYQLRAAIFASPPRGKIVSMTTLDETVISSCTAVRPSQSHEGEYKSAPSNI